jgi:hypothetical protein
MGHPPAVVIEAMQPGTITHEILLAEIKHIRADYTSSSKP